MRFLLDFLSYSFKATFQFDFSSEICLYPILISFLELFQLFPCNRLVFFFFFLVFIHFFIHTLFDFFDHTYNCYFGIIVHVSAMLSFSGNISMGVLICGEDIVLVIHVVCIL